MLTGEDEATSTGQTLCDSRADCWQRPGRRHHDYQEATERQRLDAVLGQARRAHPAPRRRRLAQRMMDIASQVRAMETHRCGWTRQRSAWASTRFGSATMPSNVPHGAQIERAMSAAMQIISELPDDEDHALLLGNLDGETDII